MRSTPFEKYHNQHGAQFVEYAGWQMPIRYGSVIEEHKACRTSGGFFDVSHMGRVRFSGRHARKFLERILTRRITDMQVGQCRYALACNEQGNVLDDVIAYRFEDDWMLVVNAANREKLLAHFNAVIEAEKLKVKVQDQTEKTAMVALQGPKVMDLVGQFSTQVPKLKRYRFAQKNLMVLKMVISRTGYTGEDGVEVILDANMASMAIKMLLKGNDESKLITPCGLAARDSLRLEAGMPLYGHELDEQTNPLEAGLGFAVSLDKGAEPQDDDNPTPPIPRFIGQDALEKVKKEGVAKTLVGLKINGRRTPRQGHEVFMAEDADQTQSIGIITSGCSSPTLGYPIAMAYVQPEHAQVGEKRLIDIGSSKLEAEIVPMPFYKPGSN